MPTPLILSGLFVCGCGDAPDAGPLKRTAGTVATATPGPAGEARTARFPIPEDQELVASFVDREILQRMGPRPPLLDAAALAAVGSALEARLEDVGTMDGWVGEVHWTRPVGWDLVPMHAADVALAPLWAPYRIEIDVPSVTDYAWGFEAYCLVPAIDAARRVGSPRRPVRVGDRVRFRVADRSRARLTLHTDDDRDRFVYGPVILTEVERLD
jgi:hypothetical protein